MTTVETPEVETDMSAAKPTQSRIVLVTGGTRGIGAAIAHRLAAAGHRIAICGRDSGRLESEAAALRQTGVEALPVAGDLADPEAAETIVGAVEDAWGGVEILINNAGMTKDGLFVRMSREDFQAILDVNLTAAFSLVRRVARGMMKARWGRIVNVSSVVAQLGNAGQANYVAAKAGLIGLTKSLALELAPRGITVNALAPGFIATDMTAGLPEEIVAAYKARIPLGRFGTPEDVAGLAAFLCSEEAAYITGQTIRVDGGLVMA